MPWLTAASGLVRGSEIDAEAGEVGRGHALRPALLAVEKAHAVEAEQPFLRRHGESIDAGVFDIGMHDACRLCTPIPDRRMSAPHPMGTHSCSPHLADAMIAFAPVAALIKHRRTEAEEQARIRAEEAEPIASWLENFPWTRLADVDMPRGPKPMMDMARFQQLDPAARKELLGDGNYGGLYQRSDEDMHAVWQVAVDEALLTDSW